MKMGSLVGLHLCFNYFIILHANPLINGLHLHIRVLFTIFFALLFFFLQILPNTLTHQYGFTEEGTELGTHQRASRAETRRSKVATSLICGFSISFLVSIFHSGCTWVHLLNANTEREDMTL